MDDCKDFLKFEIFSNFLKFSQFFSNFLKIFFNFLKFSENSFIEFSQIPLLTTRDFGDRRQITSYATEKYFFNGFRVSITRA